MFTTNGIQANRTVLLYKHSRPDCFSMMIDFSSPICTFICNNANDFMSPVPASPAPLEGDLFAFLNAPPLEETPVSSLGGPVAPL